MLSYSNHSLALITPPDLSFNYQLNVLAVDLTGQQQRDLMDWVFEQQCTSSAIWAWTSGQLQDQSWLMNAAKIADHIVINATDQCSLGTYLLSLPQSQWLTTSTIDHSVLARINSRSLADICDLVPRQ